jgi:uncharacterized protein
VARLIIDTSGYLAGMTKAHPLASAVREILFAAELPPVVSPFVVAELDYLVLSRAGVNAETAMLGDLTSGAYELAEVDINDLRTARGLVEKYADLAIGITDAVNMILADRHRTNEVLTLDQRHFRAVAPLTSRYSAFLLLPHDQQK